jgi:hypothetical protein
MVAILAGKTDGQSAKAAGVTRRAVYEWRHSPEFAAELRGRQETIFDAAMRGLLADVENAARTVSTLTDARDESVRLRAAESIIDRVASFLGGVPGGKERMAQALGVQVNINAGQPSALDIDVSGERLASIQRIMRECRIIDVTPESVIVVNPGIEHGHSGNGNGKP